MDKDEALIARLREEATYELNHQTIALLLEAAQALAVPPVQEPVAMPENWFAGMPEEYRKEAWRVATPPAQPAPVPLTDDQIEEMANDFEEGYVFLYRSFARAIEAAHGITKGQP